MALSAMWIRNNMFSSNDQHERQLTEAELKVQRSLQKLSIPDWYLNKRSNPPKILNNVTPIESRPPSWKHPKKDSSPGSTSYDLSETLPLESPKKNCKKAPDTGTYKVSKQLNVQESKQKKSSKKASLDEPPFDTIIPDVKMPKTISRTFPKMSPSRKIQNINIVFPPGPELELSNDTENDALSANSKYKTFTVKKQPVDTVKQENDTKKNEEAPRKTPKKRTEIHLVPKIVDISPRTPNVKSNFKFRTASTPKFSPANLFSSTIIEESPRTKKAPSPIILEKSSIFEDPSKKSIKAKPTENALKPRKLSQSFLQKSSIFEDSSKSQTGSLETSKSSRLSFLEGSIRSIEPILFERDDTSTTPRSSFMVREIVKKIEVSKENILEKKSSIDVRKQMDLQEKKFSMEPKRSMLVFQGKNINLANLSPCTRFMTSRKKSTDLENVIRSKQPQREKNAVKEIIDCLTEKVNRSSLPRENHAAGKNRNFVRSLVDALERGDISTLGKSVNKSLMIDDEIESSCESEGKSCATSASLKDTDSSSDSDQRSPSLKSDDELCRFDYDTVATKKLIESNGKSSQDEDSVYWIPVSRCKLPRTSSLMSMMSRLSTNAQSPCISPIRSDSELENTLPWGSTIKKGNTLSRKLFRIDETTVIDSGYSDRSDRSGNGAMTDTTWSEDTQNDSGSEVAADRMRRSSRRKSIIGNTFCIHP